MTTRTITTRVLMARAREHGRVLTTLGDGVEWSGMTWSEVVGDPEWLYHATARDACMTIAARVLAGEQSLRYPDVDEVRSDHTRPGSVELRAVRLLGRATVWGRRSHPAGRSV